MEQPQLLAVASVSCTALRKSYEAEVDGHRWRHAVLRDLSLSVSAGSCTAVVGAGLGPVTVLRCLTGLATLERGSVIWRSSDGRQVPPPPRMLLEASWRPYACQTVGDVLQAAVPPGRRQSAADRLVGLAARRCALAASLDRRVVALPDATIRLVATAAAVVAGAHWLLLDRREAVDVLDVADRAGSTGRSDTARSRNFPKLVEAAVLKALAASGYTIVVAGPVLHCTPLAPATIIALSRGRLAARREPGITRRVAERQPDEMTAEGRGRMEGEAASVVLMPVATASGPL